MIICLYLLYTLLFAFQAHSDALREEISVWMDILLFLTGTCLSVLEMRSGRDYLLSVSLLPFCVFLLSKTKKIGDGDAEILCALGSILSYSELVFMFFMSACILFVYACFRKKDRYPLVPFLFVSYLPVILCRWLRRYG